MHRSAAVDEVAHLDDIRLVLQDPVVPGQPAVKEAMLHVAADLLGAHKTPVQLRIVDRRLVGT